MKQRGLRTAWILILLICFLFSLTACGGGKTTDTKEFCQTWYKEGNDWASFVLYDDGTCEMSSKYGTGTWSVVNEDTLKLTDSYGDSNTWKIKSISSDCLILLSGKEDQYEDVYWSSPEKSLAEAEVTAQKEEAERKAEEAAAPLEILSMEDYHEGLAWVKYSEKGEKYWCCIDTNGKAVFQYDANQITGKTTFRDGYAHVDTENYSYTIDLNGQIVAQYLTDSDESIQCSEGGYVVTRKDVSGFDTAGYQYTIYGPDGTVEKQFEHERKLDYSSIQYCGKGVIIFKGVGFYFAKNQVWVDGNADVPEFCDDIAVIDTTYRDDDNGRKGGIVLLSVEGEISTYISDYMSDWAAKPSVVNENVCVVYDMIGDTIVSIDLSTVKSYPLAEQYSEKLFDNPKPETFACHDGRIVLHLRGADGDGYTCVFDKELNLVYGPINGYGHTYSDGLLQMDLSGEMQDVSMYYVNGNPVYSLTELGYKTSSVYSCGALLVTDQEGNSTYLDTTGRPLFNAIDFENVETKIIQDT